MSQIIDRRTVVVPGPMGDVTPAALQAKAEAEAARDAAVVSASDAEGSAQAAEAAADRAENVPDSVVAPLITGPSDTRDALDGVLDPLMPVYGYLDRPNPHVAGSGDQTELRFPSGSIEHLAGGVTRDGETGLVAPVDGLYRVQASGRFTANASGRRDLWMRVDGISTGNVVRIVSLGNIEQPIFVTDIVPMQAGQILTAVCFQDSGGARNIQDRKLSIELIGRL